MASSVTGTKGVIASIITTLSHYTKECDEITRVSAARIYNAADAAVPVDTGKLKASGTIREFAQGYAQGFDVVYGKGLRRTKTIYSYPDGDTNNYAWFVEFGTIHMAARPFLFPAFEQEVPNWLAALAAL